MRREEGRKGRWEGGRAEHADSEKGRGKAREEEAERRGGAESRTNTTG